MPAVRLFGRHRPLAPRISWVQLDRVPIVRRSSDYLWRCSALVVSHRLSAPYLAPCRASPSGRPGCSLGPFHPFPRIRIGGGRPLLRLPGDYVLLVLLSVSQSLRSVRSRSVRSRLASGLGALSSF